MIVKPPQAPLTKGKAASPEKQAQLEKLVEAAMLIIHGDTSGDKIHKLVVESKDPISGLSNAAVAVVMQIDVNSKGVDNAVKLELVRIILNELTGLAIRAGIVAKEQVDKPFIQELIGRVIKTYLSQKSESGTLPPEAIQQVVNGGKKYMESRPDQFSEYLENMNQGGA